jgi:hypothetical protein
MSHEVTTPWRCRLRWHTTVLDATRDWRHSGETMTSLTGVHYAWIQPPLVCARCGRHAWGHGHWAPTTVR